MGWRDGILRAVADAIAKLRRRRQAVKPLVDAYEPGTVVAHDQPYAFRPLPEPPDSAYGKDSTPLTPAPIPITRKKKKKPKRRR
jgi:hypothetical protein